MALTATMRRFDVALADSDRGVYETLALRVAQHPSESERYLVARLLARALEHAEGVDFSRGLAVDDEPALWQRDLRGDLQAWIEVGLPSADRLHRASKACRRVAVYGWRNLVGLAAELQERKVHKADAIELYALAPELLDAIAATLDRNNTWELSVAGGTIYLAVGDKQHEGTVTRVS
ncbi:MAG: YaeQ family protein [Myxococcales bacterium]|nr:YaeQ family protein [Myxococcales bacterium]